MSVYFLQKQCWISSEPQSWGGLLKIRQNTAIYGYILRTAEVLCSQLQHKGKQRSKIKCMGLIFVNKINKKYNCKQKQNCKMHDFFQSIKVKKCSLLGLTPKFHYIAREADTFLASEIDRLDWKLDFHPNGHLVAISFKQHNSAQIRGSVRAFRTTCCVSSPQNDWACLYCLIIILSLQFIGQNAANIAHLYFNVQKKHTASVIYCIAGVTY